jgi:hypothetical protein
MKIFNDEKSIAHLIENKSSFAFYTKVLPSEDKLINRASLLKTQASIPDLLDLGVDVRNDKDLYYNKSILVSVGRNLNDDVFDGAEVWNARNTPEDKPSNMNHDEKKIVGHITGNWPIDESGQIIPEDIDVNSLPETFHIFTSNVIYLHWEDPAYKEEVINLVRSIEEGKKYVSMECLFTGFDYAMEFPDGSKKILIREEATAYLSKHLRAYGGTGKYQDVKIGRLLRNISFCGKGYVDKPANPESIIFSENDFTNFNNAKFLTKSEFSEKCGVSTKRTDSSTGSKKMDELELLKQQVNTLKTELENARAEIVKAESEDKILALENELAEAKDKLSKMQQLEDDSKAMKAQLDEALVKIASYETEKVEAAKKELFMKRKAQLVEAGMDSEEAEKAVTKFELLSDEDFLFISELASRAAKKKEEKMEKKEDKSTCEEAEEVIETLETSEATLSTASEDEENEKASLREDLVKLMASRLSPKKTRVK